MKNVGNPFSNTKEILVVEKALDLVVAINDIHVTTNIQLIELALSGVSMALQIHQYDRGNLVLLQKALEKKRDMFLERNLSSASLISGLGDLIVAVQNLIDKV